MRVYADENVWMPVVAGLRRRSWDVLSVFDADTVGESDREHLEHAGIVYTSQYGKNVGELVHAVDAVLNRIEDRGIAGEVVYA